MKLASKMMAVAVLALVAGSASAATLTAVGSPAAVGTNITINITGATDGAYTISVPGAVTVVPPSTSVTVTAGIGSFVVTSTLAGNYNISIDEDAGPDAGATSVAFTDDTLDVTINVSLSVPVQVVLFDGTNEVAGITWSLALKALNSTYTSAPAGTDPTVISVRNNGGAGVNVQASLQANGNWLATTQTGALTTIDRFWVNAIGADFTRELTGAGQVITNAIAPGATSATSLVFHTPTTVSTTTSGNIVVRYFATVN